MKTKFVSVHGISAMLNWASGMLPRAMPAGAVFCNLILAGVILASLVGCGRTSRSQNDGDQGAERLAVQLNWYPESEHGGVYQAQVDQRYREADMEVEIRPGGANTPLAAELQLGRAAFAIENADDVVLQRRQGADVVAVAAVVQNSPRCILVQKSTGVTSLEDLGGMTLQRQAGRSFLQFMRQRGVLDDVKEVPYLGGVSSLVADPNIAIQAYLFSEPLLAEQAGVEVNVLMVSDLGWNPYSSVLVTTGEMIRDKPELVQRFVDATLAGWRDYLLDPSRANTAILEANRHGMTAETLQYGVDKMRDLAMPDNMDISQVGTMSDNRWQTLVDQMDRLDPSQAGGVKAADCYTLEFLNFATPVPTQSP